MAAEMLERRVWEWLPARADRRRVTIPTVIANALAVPVAEVLAVLGRMETSGHAIRDRQQGQMSARWHRGLPYPPTRTSADPQGGLW